MGRSYTSVYQLGRSYKLGKGFGDYYTCFKQVQENGIEYCYFKIDVPYKDQSKNKILKRKQQYR